MKKYAVLIKFGRAYVKEWDFFVQQGGLSKPWGKDWKPIRARSIEEARRKAIH